MARQLTFRSLQLWQMIPIAAILHAGLFWLPIQTGASKSPEQPKPVEATVKLSALPSPAAMPKPSPSAQPVVLPAVSQPVLPQPPRQIIVPSPAAQPPAVQPPAAQPPAAQPLAVQPPQAPSPQAPPPQAPPPQTPPPQAPAPKVLDTTTDMLSHLGGQPCGLGCFQVGDKTLGDVIEQFQQRFGTVPEEIRDINTEMLLGYAITNRKGEKEYLYYSSVAASIVGQPGLIHSFRQLPELINDRQQLVARGVM